jgi:hypothetical protein
LPIGLGHAQRDVAIAPASARLANESGHIESESAEHDLNWLVVGTVPVMPVISSPSSRTRIVELERATGTIVAPRGTGA